jgi:hypothetical protein
MMRSAVFSGNDDQFHKEKNGFVEMVDVQDEGVEETITGVNPNTFKEHNNNMKLNAKFIGTTTPLTPSSVETELTDPNDVQENNNEKRTVTSGFSANMQGTTVNDTPTTNAELHGRLPNGNIQTDMTGQTVSTMEPTAMTSAVVHNDIKKVQGEKSINPIVNDTSKTTGEINARVPTGNLQTNMKTQPVGTVEPTAMTSAVVHNDIKKVQGEKSINPIVNDTSKTTGEINARVPTGNLQTDMTRQPVGTVEPTTTTPAVVPNAPNRVQREKSFNPKKNQIEPTNASPKGSATDKKAAISTVNPYTDENPKTLQENTRASDDKREDKMRKSVSFATENPLINANASSSIVPPGTNSALPNANNSDNTSIPGTVPEGPGPIITLPREPSNLMPPRNTTLPEIDLSKF